LPSVIGGPAGCWISFDHRVSGREQRGWNGEAERPCSLEIDDQLNPRRLNDRQVCLTVQGQCISTSTGSLAEGRLRGLAGSSGVTGGPTSAYVASR
jgi:hypothetical protein